MSLALLIAFVVVSLLLAGVATTTLAWMLYSWRTPLSAEATGFVHPVDEPQLSFTVIVPARHEERVLGETLRRLAHLDHPDYEVLAVVGHDDEATHAVAAAAAAAYPERVRVVVDHSWPKNKPKALNTALAESRGDVLAVFDAEDEVAPDLLRRLDAHMRATDADVVQGGVQLMDHHSSWYSVRNVLEYYFWFRSRLHFQADQGFIPLGGNTFCVRTALVRAVGGWDDDCLAEDCEIGVRLSSRGAVVSVAYDPALVTREETPGSLGQFVKQRTRWNQGFLQVLRKGEWRQLPTRRQRFFARYTLSQPFLQAFTGIMVPLSLLTVVLVKAPVLLVLLSFVPLLPTVTTVAVEVAGLGEFCAAYGRRARLRDYLKLVLGTPFFQVLLAYASLRAVWRELRRDHSWEKTTHTNAHREGTSAAAAAALPAPDNPVDVRTVEERQADRARATNAPTAPRTGVHRQLDVQPGAAAG